MSTYPIHYTENFIISACKDRNFGAALAGIGFVFKDRKLSPGVFVELSNVIPSNEKDVLYMKIIRNEFMTEEQQTEYDTNQGIYRLASVNTLASSTFKRRRRRRRTRTGSKSRTRTRSKSRTRTRSKLRTRSKSRTKKTRLTIDYL
jgi:hypothetical protein